MKLLALAILLVTVCCLEGAFVKREAEAQEASQVPHIAATAKEYLDSIGQYFTTGVFTEEKIQQIKAQAETLSAQVHEQFKPLTEQVKASFNQLIESLKESIQSATSS